MLTGTAIIVHTALTDPSSGAASASLTLHEFLSGIPASSLTRLVFTGHSLGGVLSPTLALALVTSGALKAEALVYPIAGPSPGNGSFANLFSHEYAVWNTNIINSLDIVPQVWCTKPEDSPSQNLDNISPIYGSPVLPTIEWGIAFLRAKANLVDTVYMPLQSRIISGGSPTST